MKANKITIISITVLLFFMCCKKTNKTDFDNVEQSCLPGFVWINYVGITDKIKRFTLIRTSKNDSLFLSYYKNEWGGGFVNDSLFFAIYCNNYITDSKQLSRLKNYIISHNTSQKEELANVNNYNAVKVAIIDQCDSVEYIVNSGNKGYFSNMIDSLDIKDKSLIEYLDFYERIINDTIKDKSHIECLDYERIINDTIVVVYTPPPPA